MLWNNEQTRTALCMRELGKVARHGRLVVRGEDAAIACGTGKDFVVSDAGQAGCRGSFEVDGRHRLSTADTII